jgi:hypothetical protein
MSCVTMTEQQAAEILPVMLRYGADPSDNCPMKTSAVAFAKRFGKKKNSTILQAAIDALAAAPPAVPAMTAATAAAEVDSSYKQNRQKLGINLVERKK